MISLCEVKTLFIYIGLIFVGLIAKVANSFLSSAAIHLSWVLQRMLVAKESNAFISFGNNLSGSPKRPKLLPHQNKIIHLFI